MLRIHWLILSDKSVLVATENLKLQVFLPFDWQRKARTPVVSHRQLVDDTLIDSIWAENTLNIKIDSPCRRTYLIEVPALKQPKNCRLNERKLTIEKRFNEKENMSWYDAESQKIFVRCTDLSANLELTY